MTEVLIRPMLAADVPAAERFSDEAFYELDLRASLRTGPDPERRTTEHSARWISRTVRLLEHDPGGCWVAEDESVRPGGPADVPLMDALARDLRGGGHGTDHAPLAEMARPLVAETETGHGFAYTDGARLAALAATDEATARALLWACLADAGEEYLAPHVTAANQWAIDVALTAGLELAQSGYLAVRGMAPPAP